MYVGLPSEMTFCISGIVKVMQRFVISTHRYSSSTSIEPFKIQAIYSDSYDRLIKSGFSQETAIGILTSLDKIATDKASELSNFYLSLNEYDEILKMYHHHIERFHHDSQTIQSTHHDSERGSYSALSTNVQHVSEMVMEEIKALESGLQLDVSLEKKKTDESLKNILDSANEADVYMKNKLQGVQNDLKSVETHARSAIVGFISILSLSFIGYNLFTKS